jgi:hypothetical protein
MIGGLIAAMAVFGPWGYSDQATIKTVPFTFEARMSQDSPLIGTNNTLFVVDWPHVVAIDAGTGKRLWDTVLTSHAAVNWSAFNRYNYWGLGAFPVEVGGSVAFCFTYAKPDGTIETEIESRGRKDGVLNFIVHVETRPVSAARISNSATVNALAADVKRRKFYSMNWPNVAGVGKLLLVVPDPEINPELFVVSAETGAVKDKIRSDKVTPSSVPEQLHNANTISLGACLFARGELISLANSPYGAASRLVYLGDRIVAQYLGERYWGALSYSERQGIALFPWSPTQHGKIEDIWHGAFFQLGPPKEKPFRFGPCVGWEGGNPVILRTDWKGEYSLVTIDEQRNVVPIATLDTDSVWQATVGDSGVFLLYGRASNDLYDLNGNKLLSLRTKHLSVGDTVYWHTTLLPCGVAWTNYSRIGPSAEQGMTKFKFFGAVVSLKNKRFAK